jgi:hypothetical protein
MGASTGIRGPTFAVLVAALLASWPVSVAGAANGEEKREIAGEGSSPRLISTPSSHPEPHHPSLPDAVSPGDARPHGIAHGSTNNHGPPVKVFIIPSSAVVRADESFKFAARGMDADGNIFVVGAGWSAENGTVDETGQFTPWSEGDWNIHAWYAGFAGGALARVVPGSVRSLKLVPADVEVPVGGKATVGLEARDSKGNPVITFSAVWEDSEGLRIEKVPSSLTDLRLHALKAGRWQLEVFVGDGNRTASASALVAVKSDDYLGLAALLAVAGVAAVGLHVSIKKRREDAEEQSLYGRRPPRRQSNTWS